MTAPTPPQGTYNPWTGAYQTQQYDIGTAASTPRGYSGSSILDDLANPPAAAVTASSSPQHVFNANTNPPVGAGGNEPGVPPVTGPF
jgi:hypothetical protein